MSYGWKAHVEADHARRRTAAAEFLSEHAIVPVLPSAYADAFWAVETALSSLSRALDRCGLAPSDCAAVDISAREMILQRVRSTPIWIKPTTT